MVTSPGYPTALWRNELRQIEYELLPPVGDLNIPKKEDFIQFLRDLIPYDFKDGLIPPLKVLNDLFSKGIKDSGMGGGCQWKQFAISEKEYNELRKELLNYSEQKFSDATIPKWIENYDDWFIWKQEYKLGIPILKNMELHLNEKKFHKLQIISKEIGDEESFWKYYEKYHDTSEQSIELSEPYIDEYQRKNKIGKYSER